MSWKKKEKYYISIHIKNIIIKKNTFDESDDETYSIGRLREAASF